jgi:hypothetical protein
LCWLSISHNNEHFIIDIFIRYWISFTISWSNCNDCVILNLKLPISLLYNNHWFCILIDFFRLRPYRHKLNIIIYSQNLPTCLCFNIFFCNIFRFIVKKSMRISWPCYTSHINFILLIEQGIIKNQSLHTTTHGKSSNTWEASRALCRQVLLSIAIAQIDSCACLSWSFLSFQ